MKKSFTQLESPVLAGVVKEETAKSVIAEIKNNSLSGANAFDVHISCLGKEECTAEKLKQIADSTCKPIMALHYNQAYDLGPMNESDEDRMRQLLVAAKAGFACVDMQGYTFEPRRDTKATLKSEWITEHMSFVSACPNEVTLNPETIEKQIEFMNEVHSTGAEVLLSTHTECFLSCQQVMDLLDFLAQRKPDILKLVTAGCDTDEQVHEYCKTLLTIKNRYPNIKITYFCNGKKTVQTRALGVLLGAHIHFCVNRYDALSTVSQLPLKETAEMYGLFRKIINEG